MLTGDKVCLICRCVKDATRCEVWIEVKCGEALVGSYPPGQSYDSGKFTGGLGTEI